MNRGFVPDATVEIEDISASVRKEFAGNNAEEAFVRDFQAGDQSNVKERRVAKRNLNRSVSATGTESGTNIYAQNMLNRVLSMNIELTQKLTEDRVKSIQKVSDARIAAYAKESSSKVQADQEAFESRKIQMQQASDLAKSINVPIEKALEILFGSTANNQQPEPNVQRQSSDENDTSDYKTVREIFAENRDLFSLVANHAAVQEFVLAAGGKFADAFKLHAQNNPTWKKIRTPWIPYDGSSGGPRHVPWRYSPACHDAILETLHRCYEEKYGSQTRITEHYAHVPNRSSD